MKRKWRPWIIRLAVALAVGLLFALLTPVFVELYHTARSQMGENAEQASEAIGHLEWLFDRSPADTDLCLRLTDAYIATDNPGRAEYTLLRGIQANADQLPLYLKLCEVYLSQDKLMDAVSFLDGISDPLIKEQLDALRPFPPVLFPAPGRYEELVTLSLSLSDDTEGFLSVSGQSPSMESDRFTQPLTLSVGRTHVRAVVIRGGLPSAWTEGEYVLENVVLPMVFADPTLERILREQVGNPDGQILSSDLWGITHLAASVEPQHFTSLEDLSHLQNLVSLSLYGDGTKVDIAPLAGLIGLRSLKLKQFALDSSDLETISEWTWLEELSLPDNRLSTIGPVSQMSGLSLLDLSGNHITDASPLSDLLSLVDLDISYNSITDTSKLATLAGLKRLSISDNGITSLRGLVTMTRLEQLDISYNGVSDLWPLSGLTRLVVLECRNCPISSLEPLRNLVRLEVLYATGGEIQSADPLSAMTALRVLYLDNNRLFSLGGLENCTALEILHVNQNQLISLDVLAGLPALTEVSVESNQLTSLSPLNDCPALVEVFAASNPLLEEDNQLGEDVVVHTDFSS